MDDQRNDFVVNSKGHCFFCLNKTSVKSCTNKSLYTLQCLSQYLKLDMTTVFSQKGSIDPSLLAKVKQSRLKVELCEGCANLTNGFSVVFQQWEKMEMEMQAKLSHIQEKLLASQKLETFVKPEGGDEGVQEVLDVLRMETSAKCFNKIGHLAPRIKIQKLTRKSVQLLTTRKSKRKTAEPIRSDNGFIFQADERVKMESQNEDLVLEEEDGENANFHDDMAPISDDYSMGQAAETETAVYDLENVELEPFTNSNMGSLSSSASKGRKSREQRCSIDPATGKYKCSLCLKEFGRVAFHFHYKSVHLKIRYKCLVCEHEFTQKSSLKFHQRKQHSKEKEKMYNPSN